MIEQGTNYAYKVQYLDNPSFYKIRELAISFYKELPEPLQTELYDKLNHGVDILDSEPLMGAYLFAFGQMHKYKLNKAFENMPYVFFTQPEIRIIDYGCGQAVGTICYADFLKEQGYTQQIKAVTLIEPSECCLKRAALHTSKFFPDAEIATIHKTFNDLTSDDIRCEDDIPTLHILSNVLDLNFDLVQFATLIKENSKGYNQFVCVGPYFSLEQKDERIKAFCQLLNATEDFSHSYDKYELNPDKQWTANIYCFSIGKPKEELSTEATDEDIKNGVKDEFGVVYSKYGNQLLKCHNDETETSSIKAEITDRMSAAELKQRENSTIKFFEGNKGNLFFTCGTVTGYVHPKVQQSLEEDTLQLSDLQYAVIRKEGQEKGVPCLFLKNKH